MDKKIILYIVVVVLVAVGLFYYWNNKNKDNVANVQPVIKAVNPLIIRNPFSKYNKGR